MNMRFILSYYHGIVIPISTELSESLSADCLQGGHPRLSLLIVKKEIYYEMLKLR